jgi:hypothetical protein
MQCKQCKKEFTPARYANNVKFCSPKCRESTYVDYRKSWQQRNRAKYREGKLQCLICDGWFEKICSHTWQAHGMDNVAYKKMFGIDLGKGLVTESYKEHKREMVLNNPDIIKNNLLKAGHSSRFTKGDPRFKYVRSAETLQRLKQQSFIKKKI